MRSHSLTSYLEDDTTPLIFHRHNIIVVSMIPDLVMLGNPSPWPVLPPGVHDADFSEIATRFAITPHRKWLLQGALAASRALSYAGCRTLYLNGSFTTGKPAPGDYDGCWEPDHVDPAKLDPVLLTFDNKRQAQKQKYRGELFIKDSSADGRRSFFEFFQIDKYSGKPKGIIRISLMGLSETP